MSVRTLAPLNSQLNNCICLCLHKRYFSSPFCRLPSLEPKQDFHMPPYTAKLPIYTAMTSLNGRTHMTHRVSYKPDKMAFWNKRVPSLYLQQLRHDFPLLKQPSSSPADVTYLEVARPAAHPPGNWILISACVGLCATTVLLSVCYCHARRQVSAVTRQRTGGSGQSMI